MNSDVESSVVLIKAGGYPHPFFADEPEESCDQPDAPVLLIARGMTAGATNGGRFLSAWVEEEPLDVLCPCSQAACPDAAIIRSKRRTLWHKTSAPNAQSSGLVHSSG